MGDAAPSVASGYFLWLVTESFAVRALVGSLIAAGLAGAAVRAGLVRTTRARRRLVLAPLAAAAVAGIVTVFDSNGLLSGTYLPRLSVTVPQSANGQVLELLGEARVLSSDRGVDVLLLAWALVVTVLLARRSWGLWAARRLVRRAAPVPPGSPLAVLTRQVAARMHAPAVSLRLLPGCPGGAFTARTIRPVVVVDPRLVAELDEREVEGLIAHELAHVVRKDPLQATVAGVLADVAFFVPTLALATRWLRREQEHTADELASTATRRPAALASSILKVWGRAPDALQPCGTCAAVPRLALAGTGPRLSPAARVVAVRVERLIDPPAVSAQRRLAESALVGVAVAVMLGATLLIPGWIAGSLHAPALGLSYLPAPAAPEESPAFATFRALAPPSTVSLGSAERLAVRLRAPATAQTPLSCPCLETQAQLAAGIPAADPDRPQRMTWQRSGESLYDLQGPSDRFDTRPLWTLEAGSSVGFFVVEPAGS